MKPISRLNQFETLYDPTQAIIYRKCSIKHLPRTVNIIAMITLTVFKFTVTKFPDDFITSSTIFGL